MILCILDGWIKILYKNYRGDTGCKLLVEQDDDIEREILKTVIPGHTPRQNKIIFIINWMMGSIY
jgi:hypothetical protein